jgi:hypothetical protein
MNCELKLKGRSVESHWSLPAGNSKVVEPQLLQKFLPMSGNELEELPAYLIPYIK